MKLLGRLLLILTCSLAVTRCAAPLPDADQAQQPRESVRISTRDGLLTYQQSRQIIARLDKNAGGTDFLARHLQVEEAVSSAPLVAGNGVTLFSDGPSTYKSMGDAIKDAKQFIHLESYIYEDDDVGNRLTDLLIAKHNEGVQVAVMVDDVGTLGVPRTMFDKMSAAGIPVVFFNPVNPLESRNGWSVNERSHRKILVVDGKIGYVGGINVSSVYSSHPGFGGSRGKKKSKSDDKDDTKPWRDTHLRIQGPAVADIERVFLSGWKSQKGPKLDKRDFFPAQQNAGPHVVRILENRPGDNDSHAIYLTLLSAISTAEQSVHITMAYFVPDPGFLDALCDAAKRGVDVTLILPSFSDSSLVLHAGHSYYGTLLKAGVKIYERKDALLHAKTAVVDGVWSTAGSSNLDWRSFTLNHEINAVVLGTDFGGQMERLFTADIGASQQITLDHWRHRPMSDRMMEMIARLGERWL
jgi:cardiolipin synthase